MGKVVSLMGRPLRNFNVEGRAHKVIGRDKPVPAPMHKSDQMDLDRLMKDYPEVYEESLKKNEQLDKYLKNVFVKSHDPLVQQQSKSTHRPLPLDRSQVADFEYGFKEPDKIPLGKTTLKKALQFITDHQTDPVKNSTKNIAKDYLLPEDTVKTLLKFYRVFEVYIPEQRKVKAKFAGPSVPRIRIITHPRKQLAGGAADKNET